MGLDGTRTGVDERSLGHSRVSGTCAAPSSVQAGHGERAPCVQLVCVARQRHTPSSVPPRATGAAGARGCGSAHVLQLRTTRGRVVKDALCLKDVERRHRRRARDRVAAVGAAAAVGRRGDPTVRDRTPGEDSGEWVATGETLGADEHIGRHALVIHRPHPAGSALCAGCDRALSGPPSTGRS